MTTFNTNFDCNERARQMDKARHVVETRIWQMIDLFLVLFATKASTSENQRAKSVRRVAARRSVDTLLR
jgi:hypothetical protein